MPMCRFSFSFSFNHSSNYPTSFWLSPFSFAVVRPCPVPAARRARWCNVTVAQGMEGDGKKEDLTVLLRTSTHRTQKVRSSMEIVQRLRQRYLQFLQVVVDVLTDEVSYRDFEDRLRQDLDALGRDIVKWVVESCDERLREGPQARPGWVVARRGDEKQLLTPFGMRSEEHTSELQSRPHLVCRLL